MKKLSAFLIWTKLLSPGFWLPGGMINSGSRFFKSNRLRDNGCDFVKIGCGLLDHFERKEI